MYLDDSTESNIEIRKVAHHDGGLRTLCGLGDESKVLEEGLGRRGLCLDGGRDHDGGRGAGRLSGG